MKKIILAALLLTGVNSFASSVCIYTLPYQMGDEQVVNCDGKTISRKEWHVDMDTLSLRVLTLKKLTDQGYKIVSQDKDTFTLVKE